MNPDYVVGFVYGFWSAVIGFYCLYLFRGHK